MKLVDIFLESRLFELAHKRKKSIMKISSLSESIATEILKILMYKDSKNQNHWRGKLNGYFKSIKRISQLKEGNFSKKQWKTMLWDEFLGETYQIEEYINDIENEYYKPSYHIDYNNINQLSKTIEDIYDNIIKDIIDKKTLDINNYIK